MSLATALWILSTSSMQVGGKGTDSQPKRMDGIAMQRHVVSATSEASGPDLDTFMQAPLYRLAREIALFLIKAAQIGRASCRERV